MVRRPGHHAVVGQHLAQRRLRHVDGEQARGRDASGVEHSASSSPATNRTRSNIDAQPTTRAIRAEADTPDEIDQMFDGIAYGKAGDVLLMVENYLGEETFRKGVHAYLAAHEYGNADGGGLLERADRSEPQAGRQDHGIAGGRSRACPSSPSARRRTAQSPSTQSRFFLSPGITPDPAQKWTLPVCFKTARCPGLRALTPGHAEPAGAGREPLLRQRRRQGLLPQRLRARAISQTLSPTSNPASLPLSASACRRRVGAGARQQSHRRRLSESGRRAQVRSQRRSALERRRQDRRSLPTSGLDQRKSAMRSLHGFAAPLRRSTPSSALPRPATRPTRASCARTFRAARLPRK